MFNVKYGFTLTNDSEDLLFILIENSSRVSYKSINMLLINIIKFE